MEASGPTYFEEKQRRKQYNFAKTALLGPQGPFSGWLGNTGLDREMFNAEGVAVCDMSKIDDGHR